MLSHTAALAKLQPGKTRKARKPKATPAPNATEHACVIVAVDTARRSGYCVWSCGDVQSCGWVDISKDDPDSLIEMAEKFANSPRKYSLPALPIVLVLEKPWGGSGLTQQALGAARHAWLAAWRRRGQPARKVVRVKPATWRKAVLGVTRGEQLERLELATASRLWGVGPIDDRDVAAAVCIAEWAGKAGEVAAVLPKRRSKAA